MRHQSGFQMLKTRWLPKPFKIRTKLSSIQVMTWKPDYVFDNTTLSPDLKTRHTNPVFRCSLYWSRHRPGQLEVDKFWFSSFVLVKHEDCVAQKVKVDCRDLQEQRNKTHFTLLNISNVVTGQSCETFYTLGWCKIKCLNCRFCP
jgi:hypothetical protein